MGWELVVAAAALAGLVPASYLVEALQKKGRPKPPLEPGMVIS
jgi:hypothetical protein